MIKKWAKLINAKPNCNCTHFYLSDNEKVMIIDLTRMTKMPTVLKKLSDKEKSYLFINLDDSKAVRYYAYNICPKTFAFIGEKDGQLLMNIVEDDVLKYIEDNISELTNEKAPLSKIVEMNKGEYQKILPPVHQPTRQSYEGNSHFNNHYNGGHRTNHQYPYGQQVGTSETGWAGHNSNNNNFTSYKERDQFTETLYGLIKTGRTGPAVDHIQDFMTKKLEDKDMLNMIFRSLSTDKLDFISLKELLLSTEKVKEQIYERAGTVTKFIALVRKSKPGKAELLLKGIQIDARSL